MPKKYKSGSSSDGRTVPEEMDFTDCGSGDVRQDGRSKAGDGGNSGFGKGFPNPRGSKKRVQNLFMNTVP